MQTVFFSSLKQAPLLIKAELHYSRLTKKCYVVEGSGMQISDWQALDEHDLSLRLITVAMNGVYRQ